MRRRGGWAGGEPSVHEVDELNAERKQIDQVHKVGDEWRCDIEKRMDRGELTTAEWRSEIFKRNQTIARMKQHIQEQMEAIIELSRKLANG